MLPAPYFDPALDAWVFSRYADVLAAFRDPNLWTTTLSGQDQDDARDGAGKLAARVEMQEGLAAARVAEWQVPFDADVARQLALLARDRPVDLLGEFLRPVCLELAARVTGVRPDDMARLGELGAIAFKGTGAPKGSSTRAEAATATAELNRYFENAPTRMGEPTFVAISQTMGRLLASGWLALLQHPAECRRLRQQPELMSGAVEELLRYAGIVPTLYRRARADIAVGGARIAAGQCVHLKIQAANRDPDQFPDPDRLDVSRRAASQLALGTGRNSCVGNLVIRMAFAVTTKALLHEFPHARVDGEMEFESSPSFSWPAVVMVMLDAGTNRE